MGKRIILLLTLLTIFVTSPASAITCGQFNAMGSLAKTEEQVLNTPATSRQLTEFKRIMANHAASLSFFGFSARAKALKLVRQANLLTKVMVESLAITRHYCFSHPNDSMEKVATENFDYFLDAVAK